MVSQGFLSKKKLYFKIVSLTYEYGISNESFLLLDIVYIRRK